MRIGLIDFVGWNYTVDSPYRAPLGGSQSALCYLAEQLAAAGHDVWLLNRVEQAAASRGVRVVPLERAEPELWRSLDVAVVQNFADGGRRVRPLLRPSARLVLWTQHAHDQPAVAALREAEVRGAFDAFAFVSQWQERCYRQAFGIEPERSNVLRNAIAPAFANLYRPDESILAAKERPPILAYTSTPFRGLDRLLDAMPSIRRAVPDVSLRVFSSMQVYQTPADEDAARYGALYARCRAADGVEYVGSLPQPELAHELRRVALLAYANHFAETSCIAVMEALAAGCHVVTSDLGALRETCTGFGRLVPVNSSRDEYIEQFAAEAVSSLEEILNEPDRAESHLARQVAYLNDQSTWRVRAREWLAWLGELASVPSQ